MIPDWLAAVATSIAVIVAAITYWRNREDRHISQARKVYALHSSELLPKGEYVDVGDVQVQDIFVMPSRSGDTVRHRLLGQSVCVTVTVHNASDEVISNVEIRVSADDLDSWPDRFTSKRIPAISPGKEQSAKFVVKDKWSTERHIARFDLSTTLVFTDSAGTDWIREDARPVRELK